MFAADIGISHFTRIYCNLRSISSRWGAAARRCNENGSQVHEQPAMKPIDEQGIRALREGRFESPLSVLGPHGVGPQEKKVRAFLPYTDQAWIIHGPEGSAKPMTRVHPDGIFEAICPPDVASAKDYQLRVKNPQGQFTEMHDPYAFPPMFSEFDLHPRRRRAAP